jgi:hypothetical protein
MSVVSLHPGLEQRNYRRRIREWRRLGNWWRRWESKTTDFAPIRATTGNHGKADPELAETNDREKHIRETALPSGKIERETTRGRADVGDVPIAQTLGTLARKVLSSSRHAESRELARAVLRLLAQVRDS